MKTNGGRLMKEISEQWQDVQENFSRSEIREMLAETRAEIENAMREQEENPPLHTVELSDFHVARATLAKVTLLVSTSVIFINNFIDWGYCSFRSCMVEPVYRVCL
jgi:hypothetical protein